MPAGHGWFIGHSNNSHDDVFPECAAPWKLVIAPYAGPQQPPPGAWHATTQRGWLRSLMRLTCLTFLASLACLTCLRVSDVSRALYSAGRSNYTLISCGDRPDPLPSTPQLLMACHTSQQPATVPSAVSPAHGPKHSAMVRCHALVPWSLPALHPSGDPVS